MEKRYNLDGPKIEGLGVIALALIIILQFWDHPNCIVSPSFVINLD
jgi:hypothetical protein